MLIGTADVINKLARKSQIPIESYLLIQSPIFSCIILFITLSLNGINICTKDIFYCLIGAIFSFSAFTIMLHSLTHGCASINYTVFRLSFIFSSTAAIVFLNETITRGKLIGITLVLMAILLFFHSSNKTVVLKKSLMIAVIAMLLSACFQFILKLAALQNTSSPSFLLFMSLFFLAIVVLYNIFRGHFSIPRKTFLYAPLNGCLMAIGTLSIIFALSTGEASIVLPIVQLSFLVTGVLAVILLKEKINLNQIIGIIFAATAIVILSWF